MVLAVYPTFEVGDHEAFMEYALTQAQKSPPAGNKFCVGAVLVNEAKGKVLSTGYSLEYPSDYKGGPGTTHAEQCCLIKIADEHNLPEERIHEVLPPDTVLYTTMEPCNERLSGNMTCVTRILKLNGAIKTVYVGIREHGTFIANNDGKERLEEIGVKVDDAKGYDFGSGNTNIDPAVLRVTSIETHGVSFWVKTGRIDVLLKDGAPQSFFIKVLSKAIGMNMTKGEYHSMSAIHAVIPEFVPKPIACGTYEDIPDIHFFLCEFREMTEDMPDPDEFASRLSTMHQKSVSPTGKFGFHITTYAGNLPQYVAWEDSWETFFAKSTRQALDLEISVKGNSNELEVLLQALFEKVIPRLLRPLESEGRTVKPSLIHDDLWYANAGIDVENDQPLVFDACCFFAHNEYEFGQWRPACNRVGDEYVAAYNTFA
ncbi:bifunctional RIB2 [Fusarium agapanthi]|uniref:protein-ribulosamine 3-kinase n=1 Tax=Fusarium agapanthi TaxID=1803897 RepID=A0A9P5BFX7_9HYPO|nr:bifunctional RIB2 [Fusarium agapanthi]